jgi:hypothetical protein
MKIINLCVQKVLEVSEVGKNKENDEIKMSVKHLKCKFDECDIIMANAQLLSYLA